LFTDLKVGAISSNAWDKASLRKIKEAIQLIWIASFIKNEMSYLFFNSLRKD
jgi:hypothetical protein